MYRIKLKGTAEKIQAMLFGIYIVFIPVANIYCYQHAIWYRNMLDRMERVYENLKINIPANVVVIITLFILPIVFLCGITYLLIKVGIKARSLYYGKKYEDMVQQKLCSSGNDEYHIFKNVFIPLPDGGTTEVDMVYVGRDGIYFVEVKYHFAKKCAYYNSDRQDIHSPQINFFISGSRKDKLVQNPFYQNDGHIRAFKSLLNIKEIKIMNVVISNAEFNHIYFDNKYNDIVNNDDYVAITYDPKKDWRVSNIQLSRYKRILSEEDVGAICKYFRKLEGDRVDMIKHIGYVSSKHKKTR